MATVAFIKNPDLETPWSRWRRACARSSAPTPHRFLDATRPATALLWRFAGDQHLPFGYAWQMGLIPLSREAIRRAID
jgi:indolepyruvate ferredoxin oxidoreductase